MNKIRVKFIRGEEVKYISHLDLMKAFERALRRSQIPVAYSQGFSPHPNMVFGLPLSVGVTSEAEYADFELAEPLEPAEFVERLNLQLPSGLKIIGARKRKVKENIMASVAMASYDVSVSLRGNTGMGGLQTRIDEFMQKPSITVKKEGKRGMRDVDIRPMIHKLDVRPGDESSFQDGGHKNILCISMLLSAGSVANLKPELLISALNEVTGLDTRVERIHRTGLFVEKGGKILEPLDACD